MEDKEQDKVEDKVWGKVKGKEEGKEEGLVRGEEGEEWVEAAVRVLALVANAFVRSAGQGFRIAEGFHASRRHAPSANQR